MPDEFTVRVAVIDDHDIIHDGIRGWCALSDPPVQLVSAYTSPDEFLAATAEDTIDAVVLDLQFPDRVVDLRALTDVCERGFRVVVYSHYTDTHLVLECLDRGAVTYLSKTEGRQHLLPALRAAAAELPYLTPTMAKAMTADQADTRPHLSNREREILINWFQTESKTLVAKSLYISVKTIDTHLDRIRTKYAAVGRPAKTKAALVVRAIQDGIVSTDDL